ncbi:DNA cytosine methyltransferase [Mycoplasmopsis felis]|uniref:DNA cytosine methyltransferase n=1 Tax=Mycoplasmopsis felis TaxID=33923 RepID=UPI002FF1C75C
MKRYKSIELFAGAGGLAIGLEKAGFEHIGLVEIDKNAANTLRLNRTKWNVIQEDISILSNQDLEKKFNIKKFELDLLSGGPPCQSFSYAGKRLYFRRYQGNYVLSLCNVFRKIKT